MKVLIIEDQKQLVQYLKKGLEQEGFIVDNALTGIDGLHLALEENYDVIVLDRMLPTLDGIGLLKALRSKKQTPVIMCTARGETEERVEGLEQGADDYLTKPFAFSELVARIKALIRRSGQTIQENGKERALVVGDLLLDPWKLKVSRKNKAIDLTSQEFKLLQTLMKKSGQVLSKTFLTQTVWDINFDSETNVVEVAIKRLRAKVDDEFDYPLIHTQRGMGYVLEDRRRQNQIQINVDDLGIKQ